MNEKKYKLYGIRTEIFIEEKKEEKDAILFLLKDSFKYEYSVKKKILRKVPSFIAPEYISINRKIIIDLALFLEDKPFSIKELSYKNKISEDNLIPELCLKSDFFRETKSIRNIEKRPVWIFSGNSGLGKSYIGTFLSESKDVYETDSSDTLPDIIYSDVIIIGNKYNYKRKDIENRLFGDVKIINVEFS